MVYAGQYDSILQQHPGSAAYDSFGRLRVGNPTSVFYGAFQYNINPLVYDQSTTGTGSNTIDTDTSLVDMATSAASDEAIIQSIDYHRYQPGKSQLVKITGVFGAADAGVKRMGYFDGSDGIFVQQGTDGTISIVKRSSTTGSPVDTAVAQSSWNTDLMDGVDFTKAMIFWCDIEWLGVGSVRCGFVVDGKLRVAHVFHHAGTVTGPYMRSASLPVRWQISQAGEGSGAMKAICAAVDSEGGTNDELGLPVSAGNGITAVSVDDAETVLFALRPATTLSNRENRRTIVLESLSAIAFTNAVNVKLYVATSVTAGDWAAVDSTPLSSMQISLNPSAFSGLCIKQFNVPASATNRAGAMVSGINSRVAIGLDIAGTAPKTWIVVTAQEFTGAATASASLSWRELY